MGHSPLKLSRFVNRGKPVLFENNAPSGGGWGVGGGVIDCNRVHAGAIGIRHKGAKEHLTLNLFLLGGVARVPMGQWAPGTGKQEHLLLTLLLLGGRNQDTLRVHVRLPINVLAFAWCLE